MSKRNRTGGSRLRPQTARKVLRTGALAMLTLVVASCDGGGGAPFSDVAPPFTPVAVPSAPPPESGAPPVVTRPPPPPAPPPPLANFRAAERALVHGVAAPGYENTALTFTARPATRAADNRIDTLSLRRIGSGFNESLTLRAISPALRASRNAPLIERLLARARFLGGPTFGGTRAARDGASSAGLTYSGGGFTRNAGSAFRHARFGLWGAQFAYSTPTGASPGLAVGAADTGPLALVSSYFHGSPAASEFPASGVAIYEGRTVGVVTPRLDPDSPLVPADALEQTIYALGGDVSVSVAFGTAPQARLNLSNLRVQRAVDDDAAAWYSFLAFSSALSDGGLFRVSDERVTIRLAEGVDPSAQSLDVGDNPTGSVTLRFFGPLTLVNRGFPTEAEGPLELAGLWSLTGNGVSAQGAFGAFIPIREEIAGPPPLVGTPLENFTLGAGLFHTEGALYATRVFELALVSPNVVVTANSDNEGALGGLHFVAADDIGSYILRERTGAFDPDATAPFLERLFANLARLGGDNVTATGADVDKVLVVSAGDPLGGAFAFSRLTGPSETIVHYGLWGTQFFSLGALPAAYLAPYSHGDILTRDLTRNALPTSGSVVYNGGALGVVSANGMGASEPPGDGENIYALSADASLAVDFGASLATLTLSSVAFARLDPSFEVGSLAGRFILPQAAVAAGGESGDFASGDAAAVTFTAYNSVAASPFGLDFGASPTGTLRGSFFGPLDGGAAPSAAAGVWSLAGNNVNLRGSFGVTLPEAAIRNLGLFTFAGGGVLSRSAAADRKYDAQDGVFPLFLDGNPRATAATRNARLSVADFYFDGTRGARVRLTATGGAALRVGAGGPPAEALIAFVELLGDSDDVIEGVRASVTVESIDGSSPMAAASVAAFARSTGLSHAGYGLAVWQLDFSGTAFRLASTQVYTVPYYHGGPGVAGTLTATGQIAGMSGRARYVGRALGFAASSGNATSELASVAEKIYAVAAQSTLAVDFGASTAALTLNNLMARRTGGGVVRWYDTIAFGSDATISGNGFAAASGAVGVSVGDSDPQVLRSSSLDLASAVTGSFEGRFFGANAAEAAGLWTLSGTNDDGVVEARGSFGAPLRAQGAALANLFGTGAGDGALLNGEAGSLRYGISGRLTTGPALESLTSPGDLGAINLAITVVNTSLRLP